MVSDCIQAQPYHERVKVWKGLYAPLAAAVSGITQQLWGDLPADDIDAARRVLAEVTRRARAQLDG